MNKLQLMFFALALAVPLSVMATHVLQRVLVA